MTLAHLVFAIATTAYIVLAIQFEEKDLVAEHGAAYERYRQRVPMLLPIGRCRTPAGEALPRQCQRRSVGQAFRPASVRQAFRPATLGGHHGQTADRPSLCLCARACLPSWRAESSRRRTGCTITAPTQGARSGAFVKLVRESTERFKDVAVAKREGTSWTSAASAGPTTARWACTSSTSRSCSMASSIRRGPRSSSTSRCRTAACGSSAPTTWCSLTPGTRTHSQPSRARRPAASLFRGAEPLRPAAVLHAARVGVEGESHRRVRELARERFVRGVQRAEPVASFVCRSTFVVRRSSSDRPDLLDEKDGCREFHDSRHSDSVHSVDDVLSIAASHPESPTFLTSRSRLNPTAFRSSNSACSTAPGFAGNSSANSRSASPSR